LARKLNINKLNKLGDRSRIPKYGYSSFPLFVREDVHIHFLNVNPYHMSAHIKAVENKDE